MREGLGETLTLQALGIKGALWKTLRSTNPIENLNGGIAKFTRNVRRWRDGSMILRWVGSAILEAEKKFRRVRGYREMPALIEALRTRVEGKKSEEEKTSRDTMCVEGAVGPRRNQQRTGHPRPPTLHASTRMRTSKGTGRNKGVEYTDPHRWDGLGVPNATGQ